MESTNKTFESIDSILNNIKLDDVSPESSGNTELPDGYYLCEVEKAELTTSKKSGKPMVALQLAVVENGIDVVVEEDGSVTKSEIENTTKRKIFLYYILQDERSVKRFVSDMLKFELPEEPGVSILPKEAFTSAATIVDSLDLLIDMRIYVNVSTTVKNGEASTWKNLVSWARADKLELI